MKSRSLYEKRNKQWFLNNVIYKLVKILYACKLFGNFVQFDLFLEKPFKGTQFEGVKSFRTEWK